LSNGIACGGNHEPTGIQGCVGQGKAIQCASNFGGYYSGAIVRNDPFRTPACYINIAILGKKTVGTNQYNLNKYLKRLKMTMVINQFMKRFVIPYSVFDPLPNV
jgi:hypothetical protein